LRVVGGNAQQHHGKHGGSGKQLERVHQCCY
jgi:hypothetical protein